MNKMKAYLKKSEKLMNRKTFLKQNEKMIDNLLFNVQKYIPFIRGEYFYRRIIKTSNEDDDKFLLKLNKKMMVYRAKMDFEIYIHTPWLNDRVNGKELPSIEKYNKFFEYKNQIMMKKIQIFIILVMIFQLLILYLQLIK